MNKLLPSWRGLLLRWSLIKIVLRRPAALYEYPYANSNPCEFLRPYLKGLPALPKVLADLKQPDNANANVVESSEPDVARMLYTLASLIQAKCIVEVGVFRGFTSRHLAEAMPDNGELFLFDLSLDALKVADTSARGTGKSIKITSVCGYSTDIDMVAMVPNNLDLVYLDADHSEAGVRRELELWMPKVRVGGLIAVHDTIHYEGICRAVNEWTHKCDAMTVATSRCCGITVLRRGS